MIGVLGVAPVHGAVLTVDNGPNGGNLDVQEITTGSTILFEVHQEGACLYVGDCHALQGDGECVGMGATEIGARVTLSVELRDRPARMTWPRIETATHIATLGCARPLEDAMRIAFEQMIYWLADDYGFSDEEAYLFLGVRSPRRAARRSSIRNTRISARSRKTGSDKTFAKRSGVDRGAERARRGSRPTQDHHGDC